VLPAGSSSAPGSASAPTPASAPTSAAPANLSPEYTQQSLADLEYTHILKTLEFTGGNKSRAAQILGIERSTLDRKLKRAGTPEQNSG
jgi:Nif-specific regulatory protein